MKIRITGASNFVNRMFEACGNYQWAREFLNNSLEAKATQVFFGIEWQAVEKRGIYRRTVIDNGCGMDRDELLRFFSTLGDGAKKIGGVHDNFGVGAKIASLPWNSEGLVVISYKGGQGAMIWIMLDPDSKDFELVEFDVDGQRSCVVDPARIGVLEDVDWAAVRPDWIRDSGTIIVMLGSEEYPDTVLGNPLAGEKDTKGVSDYLNTRFWDLSSIDLRIAELRSDKKNQWPQGPDDKDDSRRPNNRQVKGARFYLTEVTARNGRLKDKGVVMLDGDRVRAEWYLWQGERPSVHSYAKEIGYIGVGYKDELFQVTSGKVQFRGFGIIEGKVQRNLTIILRPQYYQPNNGRWDIHPDQSRNRLIFTGNGEKGIDLPMADWGSEFADKMPEPVLEAIREARGDLVGSIDDDDYRKRLQDKFGNRWTVKVLVKAKTKNEHKQLATVTNEDVELPPERNLNEDIDVVEEPEPEVNGIRRKRRKTIKIVHKRATLGGNGDAVERESPVDVPRFRMAHQDAFEKPWHLALWAPNDPEGPTVLINVDSSILQDVVEYHQRQYPEIYAEEVAKVIRQVFGEVAACKVAHSQKLARKVPEEELNRDYRSEQAMTIALMGLMAEESVIAQRLGKLGRKKPAVPLGSAVGPIE